MVGKKYFEIGELVWAKMKSYPFWPARIVNPPTDAKSSALKKARHYVFFFGSENYAWIQDQSIVRHSEEMLQSATNKKKSNSLKVAIGRIIEEAAKKAISKEKESPEVSTSGTKKKTAKGRRMKQKTEKPRVRREAVPKRCVIDETRREYIEPESGPTINLHEPNEAVRAKNVTPSNKKIGFIGLGMMGQRLVKNLLTTNHKVTIWNKTFDKCIDFSRAGATVVDNPCQVVETSDLIFCCVSDSEASRKVVFGTDGILEGLKKSRRRSKGYVEMTTVDPTTSMEIAEAITLKGGRYLEATINGTLKMAEDGALLILCAGDRNLFLDCQRCFFAFSNNVYHLSCDVGTAFKMRIIHSMLVGILQAAFAEAMDLVKRSNLCQITFMEIIERSPLHSLLFEEKGRILQSGSFPTDTSLKYQQKDLQLALSLDAARKQPMLVTAATNQVFKCAKFSNYSDLCDFYSNSL